MELTKGVQKTRFFIVFWKFDASKNKKIEKNCQISFELKGFQIGITLQNPLKIDRPYLAENG